MKKRHFLDLLTEKGRLQKAQADALRARHGGDDLKILDELIAAHCLPKEELCRLFGDTLGIAYVDLSRTIVQPEAAKLLPHEFAAKNHVIPIYLFGDGVTMASADPLNIEVRDEATRLTGKPVTMVFSPAADIDDAIDLQYASLTLFEELHSQNHSPGSFSAEVAYDTDQLTKLASDQNVVTLTRQLLLVALRERASDIHLEPTSHMLRVRLRIDGNLRDWRQFDLGLLAPVISRLKLLAGCDIAEHRRPQDGRLSLSLASRSIDIRFSSVPAINGEKIVLRVLGSMGRQSIPQLDELGFSASNFSTLKRIVGTPNGVFFVTGPTGSGKTTTLYSILQHLNQPGSNIMTIEDPVEYQLPGINQVQTNPSVELGFATALRAFLRQDPNIILVGEVRDMETAKIAAQAALTGHLVLSTMHTNNALQAVTRLVEIGVEPFLVAPSIIGVCAQRLVRRLCQSCREEYEMPQQRIANLFGDIGDRAVKLWRGRGCRTCAGTGFNGRIAVHEVFVLTEAIRHLIARSASVLDVQTLARKQGFKTMYYDGLKKALRGLTTMDEVERACVHID